MADFDQIERMRETTIERLGYTEREGAYVVVFRDANGVEVEESRWPTREEADRDCDELLAWMRERHMPGSAHVIEDAHA